MPLCCLFKEHERTKPELRVWNKDEDPSSYELSSAGREFNSKSVIIFGKPRMLYSRHLGRLFSLFVCWVEDCPQDGNTPLASSYSGAFHSYHNRPTLVRVEFLRNISRGELEEQTVLENSGENGFTASWWETSWTSMPLMTRFSSPVISVMIEKCSPFYVEIIGYLEEKMKTKGEYYTI